MKWCVFKTAIIFKKRNEIYFKSRVISIQMFRSFMIKGDNSTWFDILMQIEETFKDSRVSYFHCFRFHLAIVKD